MQRSTLVPIQPRKVDSRSLPPRVNFKDRVVVLRRELSDQEILAVEALLSLKTAPSRVHVRRCILGGRSKPGGLFICAPRDAGFSLRRGQI